MKWLLRIGILTLVFIAGAATTAIFLFPPMHDSYSTPILKTKIQFSNIYTALQLYRLDFGQYPSNEEGLAALLDTSINKSGYMSNVPTDWWGQPYNYKLVSDHPLIWTDQSVEKYGVSLAYWVGNSVQ